MIRLLGHNSTTPIRLAFAFKSWATSLIAAPKKSAILPLIRWLKRPKYKSSLFLSLPTNQTINR